ncbi:MAG: alpha/beta hydrolase [Oceanospirillaceae bacterium]|nr:alpha/beta hydrolase [Oceanospirillaceae bacterium]
MSTLFFAHANGFPSPCYAEFFDALQQHEHKIDYIEKIGVNADFPITNNWPHLVLELEREIESRHQSPVVGIGHSLGGMLSYLLARKRPELFSHLILLDPPVINGWQNSIWWLSKKFGFSDRLTPAGASKKRRTHFASREQAYDNLRGKRLFKDFTEASFKAYIQHGLVDTDDGQVTLTIDLATELALFRTAPDDLWRYRKPLAMPGLYLTAKESVFSGQPFAARLSKTAGMDYKVLEGGHLFPQEDPKGAAQTITDWLNKH